MAETHAGALRLRRAGPDDDAAIRELLRAAYPDNPKVDAALTRWQYWENPFGAPHSWVWEDGDRIVGHWTAVAVPLVLGGEEVTGAKGVDIATHPDHQRKGLFAKLAEALVADLAEAGVRALLSHPNPQSVRGVTAAGLREAVHGRVLALPVEAGWLADRFHLPEPIARLAVRLASPRGGTLSSLAETQDIPPEDAGALWQRTATAQAWGIRRDTSWWDWRYRAHPNARYRYLVVRRGKTLAGLAAARPRAAFGGRFLYVLEFLAEDAAAARQLVAGLREEAVAEGLHGVVMAVAPRSAMERLGRAGGLRPVPRRFEPFPLRCCVGAPAGAPQGIPQGGSAALAAAPWSLAWGDLDHM